MRRMVGKIVMVVALGVMTAGVPAHAQQEVAPDHFDQPFPAPNKSHVARKQSPTKHSRAAHQRQRARNMRQQRRRSA
jgi:hypothetical protein